MSNLEANHRTEITRGKNNILRSQGMVPAVLYGGDEKNELISVSKKTLENFTRSGKFFIECVKN